MKSRSPEALNDCVLWSVRLRGFFVPEFGKMRHFRWLTECAKGGSGELYTSALEGLRIAGLLSSLPEGNYSIQGALLPDSNLNPLINGQEHYFVLENDARRFCEEFDLPIGRVAKQGNFVIPEKIKPGDWAVIRQKCLKERTWGGDDRVLDELVSKEVLTPDKSGAFSVAFRASESLHGRNYLNFQTNPISVDSRLYFKTPESAEAFRQSISMIRDRIRYGWAKGREVSIEIVSH